MRHPTDEQAADTDAFRTRRPPGFSRPAPEPVKTTILARLAAAAGAGRSERWGVAVAS